MLYLSSVMVTSIDFNLAGFAKPESTGYLMMYGYLVFLSAFRVGSMIRIVSTQIFCVLIFLCGHITPNEQAEKQGVSDC